MLAVPLGLLAARRIQKLVRRCYPQKAPVCSCGRVRKQDEVRASNIWTDRISQVDKSKDEAVKKDSSGLLMVGESRGYAAAPAHIALANRMPSDPTIRHAYSGTLRGRHSLRSTCSSGDFSEGVGSFSMSVFHQNPGCKSVAALPESTAALWERCIAL